MIVIIAGVSQMSTNIAFVHQGCNNVDWYEVKNSVAPEMIGYVFRDCLLTNNYLSSSKSKIARKTGATNNDYAVI